MVSLKTDNNCIENYRKYLVLFLILIHGLNIGFVFSMAKYMILIGFEPLTIINLFYGSIWLSYVEA